MTLLEPCRWCRTVPFLVEKIQGPSREYRVECHGSPDGPCKSPEADLMGRRTREAALFDWQDREPQDDSTAEETAARRVEPLEQLRIHCATCGDVGCQGGDPERMTSWLFGHGWAAEGGKVTGWTCPRCARVFSAEEAV
jgi:hypothetical protein